MRFHMMAQEYIYFVQKVDSKSGISSFSLGELDNHGLGCYQGSYKGHMPEQGLLLTMERLNSFVDLSLEEKY